MSIEAIDVPGELGPLSMNLSQRGDRIWTKALPDTYRITVNPPRLRRDITYLGTSRDVRLEHSQAHMLVEITLATNRRYTVSGRAHNLDPRLAQAMMMTL